MKFIEQSATFPRHKMILVFLIVSSFVFTASCKTLPGAPIDLRDDEILSEHVKTAADFATGEIHQQKLKNGEYDRCTTLRSQVLTGKKQVMSGIKYYLQIKVNPVAVLSDECHQRISTGKWQPELCETEVLWQAWRKPDLQLLRSVCLQIED